MRAPAIRGTARASVPRAIRSVYGLFAIGVVLLAAGCGGQSTLDPRSAPARGIETVWWWMLAAAGVVFFGAIGMLLVAWGRRRKEGFPLLGSSKRAEMGLVVMFGIGIPGLALSALFVTGNLVLVPDTQAPNTNTTPMTIQVVGHQWFWEARYPGHRAAVADEIHIPVRTRVNVVATTDDVIHSLWVPQLNRKIDTIPGRHNRILWYADRPGRYRGQCAELCGLQHAHMALYVFADPPDVFARWLDHQSQDRAVLATPAQRRGEQVFLSNACAACHTIRGTSAAGDVGPDLTHLATRSTLAGLTVPNRRGYLGGWVLDPQHIKPGNKMPGLDLSGPQFRALLAYLESLR